MKAVAALIWIVLGATPAAGIGLTIVVATPQLAGHAMKYIPYAALAGFVVAIPFSLIVAAKLKNRLPGA